MSQSAQYSAGADEVEALSGALYAWCAEHSIRVRSQEGISAASAMIDLFLAGYTTQDALLDALSDRAGREVVFIA